WLVLGALAAVLGQQAMQGITGQKLLLQVVIALLVGAALSFLSWWFTKFRIVGDEMLIVRGILFRRSRRIRIDRLQAVDIVRPVQARLLGLAELRLEVASG